MFPAASKLGDLGRGLASLGLLALLLRR